MKDSVIMLWLLFTLRNKDKGEYEYWLKIVIIRLQIRIEIVLF